MIERVIDMFDTKKDNFLFIINRKDETQYGIADFLNKLPIHKKIFAVEPHDSGPLISLLSAREHFKPDEEVVINYCDFLMDWDYNDFLKKIDEGNYDGCLASFKGFHPASLGDTFYAYMRVDKNMEFLELREKMPFTDRRIEEHASTGTYYFRNWRHVFDFGEKLIKRGVKTNNEYYPSMIYNLMSEASLRSLVFEVRKFICLGTPVDYKQYKFWSEYFK